MIDRIRALDGRHPNLLLAVATFGFGFLFLHCLEEHMRVFAEAGVYFQQWTSERMMQTVSVEALREQPFASLVYLHVQPPLFEVIRALLVALSPGLEGDALIHRVDSHLYVIWNLCYAAMGTLIFLWVGALTHRPVGIVVALLFFLHPASIFYATFLESTMLSSFGVLWACYELWLLSTGRGGPIRLAAPVVLLFLLRSVFQWPALVVFALASLLSGVPLRKVAAFAGIAGVVVVLYTAKQYAIFGITYTSTFAGYNACRSIGGCGEELPATPEQLTSWSEDLPPQDAALVLSQPQTLHGDNYNSLSHFIRDRMLLRQFKELFFEKGIGELLQAYAVNAKIFLAPSSQYTPHVIVDRLPWRPWFDFVFSRGFLVGLLLLAGAIWVAASNPGGEPRARWLLRGLGLCLPVLFVTVVCILFERGENMRFKFFIEPVLMVFIASQLARLPGLIARTRPRKAARPPGPEPRQTTKATRSIPKTLQLRTTP